MPHRHRYGERSGGLRDLRRLGLGFKEPFPRVSIEPFGHRFAPAMYGCPCGYAVDADPWSRPRVLSIEEIDTRLDGAPMHLFHDVFRRCARERS